MNGIIVCGYPGIGKSSIAGWRNCIDLESSYFSYRNGAPQRVNEWIPQYCQVAYELMRQGYTVLVSTHEKVIEHFCAFINDGHHHYNPAVPIVIVCPSLNLRNEWLKRLFKRLDVYDKYYSKNERAYRHVSDHFTEDIMFLNTCGLPVYTIDTDDYFLQDHIIKIREEEELKLRPKKLYTIATSEDETEKEHV